MKILLTGNTGFLGSNIYNYLRSKHDVKTLSRKQSDYNFDLSIDSEIELSEEFDWVIHSAGIAHNKDNKNILRVNLCGTKRLLQALLNTKFKALTFISSVSVYGQEYGENIDEKFAIDASKLDQYGLSKYQAEIEVLNFCKKKEISCSILRLPLIVGTNAPGNLKDMMRAMEKGYFFLIGDGTARKSMVLVEDVAKQIEKFYNVNGVYNLTDGYNPSLNEFTEYMAKKMNFKKPRRLNLYIAYFMAIIGTILRLSFFNLSKYNKLKKSLTFSSALAQREVNWQPTKVTNGKF